MYDIHDYSKRVESAKRRLRSLPYSRLLLNFIDHLQALGLSKGRIAKYANHLCTLFKACPFDPRHATRMSVERVIAWIESQSYKTSTKDDLKLVVRKLVQYAKCGSCARKTLVPPEVAWFSVRSRDDKDLRVRPESLLTVDEVKAMMAAAENERDRAMISVLFEAGLRPGELLSMKVGSGNRRVNVVAGSPSASSGRKVGSLSGTGATATYSLAGSGRAWVYLAGPDGNDFDLYLKWNSPPTTSSYDARGFTTWAHEIVTCTGSGTLYYMVHSSSGSGEYTMLAFIF